MEVSLLWKILRNDKSTGFSIFLRSREKCVTLITRGLVWTAAPPLKVLFLALRWGKCLALYLCDIIILGGAPFNKKKKIGIQYYKFAGRR